MYLWRKPESGICTFICKVSREKQQNFKLLFIKDEQVRAFLNAICNKHTLSTTDSSKKGDQFNYFEGNMPALPVLHKGNPINNPVFRIICINSTSFQIQKPASQF